ncbi:glycoprotein X [Colletotrichum tabaci]|uniref:Glycoprotein X n=1 Tax=Colletotrichum tabaci TaxID=1209068 RepID=A0AAV9TNU4_9PEZI
MTASIPATQSQSTENGVPAACFDVCNNAYIEVQHVGKTPSICNRDSDFSRGYRECVSCFEANSDRTNDATNVYLEPKFRPFLDYCALQTTQTSYPSTLLMIRTVVQFADITAIDGKVLSGVLQTWTVTELKAEATTELHTFSRQTFSWQTPIPSETKPNETEPRATSATSAREPSPETSNAWIAGPVIGVLTAILLVLAGLWFLRRRRRQGLDRSAAGDNDDGKEEFLKAQLHSDCVPRQPATELEGSYPKTTPEIMTNEIAAQGMPVSEGGHVEGVTERGR